MKSKLQSAAVLTKATNLYDDSQAALYRYCDVPMARQNFLCVVKFGSDFKRYRYEGDWSESSVQAWITAWLQDKVSEYLRLEKIYEETTGVTGKAKVGDCKARI